MEKLHVDHMNLLHICYLPKHFISSVQKNSSQTEKGDTSGLQGYPKESEKLSQPKGLWTALVIAVGNGGSCSAIYKYPLTLRAAKNPGTCLTHISAL